MTVLLVSEVVVLVTTGPLLTGDAVVIPLLMVLVLLLTVAGGAIRFRAARIRAAARPRDQPRIPPREQPQIQPRLRPRTPPPLLPGPRPPARPATRPDRGWPHARRRFPRLRAEYAEYECDTMAVLRLPALADVRVASTGRFVDAFAEAQALDSDRFPGPDHAREFVAAVDRAERTWQAAVETAERIRLSGLSPTERATVERILKLLTTARDSDSEPERLVAYSLARSELAKLDRTDALHVPAAARTVLDAAARGELPPSGAPPAP